MEKKARSILFPNPPLKTLRKLSSPLNIVRVILLNILLKVVVPLVFK
jgi:hypothetical protein